jgi:hypothetical protein
MCLNLGACGVEELLFGESSRESGVVNDAGMCVRDLSALTQLLVTPQACVASSTCPKGSYCNSSTGACDWQCYTDSDCGTGGACTCLGQCLGSPGSTPTTGDPACPRNRDLLLAPATKKRDCVFDEECPYGSRCDSGLHTCTWDCLATTDPTFGCGAGASCDCLGRCSVPGVTPTAAADRRLHLEVSPTQLPVVPPSTGGWSQRRIDVVLRAPQPPTPAELAGVTLHVAADPGLLVTCDTGATPAPTCSLAAFATTSFAPLGAVYRATRYVWVSPKTPAAGAAWAMSGSVTFSSDEVAGAPQTATLVTPTEDGSALGTPQPYEGEYTGLVTFVGVSHASGGVGQASAVPTKVPVRAWVHNTAIDLQDDLALLTPTGKLRLPSTGTLYFPWLAPATSPAGTADATGSLVASVTSLSRTFTAEAGTITGRFQTQLSFSPTAASGNSYLHWQYTLTRVGATKTCATSTACPTSQICEGTLGICTGGGKWISSATATWNQIETQRGQPWLDRLGTLLYYTVNTLAEQGFIAACLVGVPCPSGYPNLFLANDVYDPTLGFASSSIDTHSHIVGADRLAQSPLSFGYSVCDRDFKNKASWS